MFSAVAFKHTGAKFEAYCSSGHSYSFKHNGESTTVKDGKKTPIVNSDGNSEFTVTKNGKMVVIKEAGGITVTTGCEANGALTVILELPGKYKGKVEGVLGNYNDNKNDDDSKFVDNEADTSLFSEDEPTTPAGWKSDYQPTDAEKSAATAVCKRAGLTVEADIAFCAEDVALTGDETWASILKASEEED